MSSLTRGPEVAAEEQLLYGRGIGGKVIAYAAPQTMEVHCHHAHGHLERLRPQEPGASDPGKRGVLEKLQEVKDQHETEQRQPKPPRRIINGEVVGRPLAPGGGPRTMEPNLCPHHQMKARGNRNSKWWTCLECQSRWDRYTYVETDQAPQGTDVLTFGCHQGRMFEDVMLSEMTYCEWILQTIENEPDTCPGLRRFAMYLTEQYTRSNQEQDSPMQQAIDTPRSAESDLRAEWTTSSSWARNVY